MAAIPASRYVLLHFLNLEKDKTIALEKANGNYEAYTSSSNSFKEEMKWWMKNLPHMFTVIHQKTHSVCIHSDASNLAWSSSSGEQETGGCWNNSKINKSPKGTNVCAVTEVKWYGGCLEV